MDPEEPLLTEPIVKYLHETRIPLRLACTMDTGWPFVLSLWYLYLDGALYCATQESARVVSHLRLNPECAFEVAADLPPYCGVRGRAFAAIEPGRGPEILELLLDRYLQGTDNSLAESLLSREDTEVAIRLEPLTLYSWNFTSRMQDSLPVLADKPCPP